MKQAAIYVLFAALVMAAFFGTLSFFFTPAYEKGTWAVIGLTTLVVTNVLSFMFGVHVPKPDQPGAAEPANQEIQK